MIQCHRLRVRVLSARRAEGRADASGSGTPGTISGASWTAAGKFGGALSFDGVDDWVIVADASSLDLTSGMTLEAWVYPTSAGGVRDIVLKEGSGMDV